MTSLPPRAHAVARSFFLLPAVTLRLCLLGTVVLALSTCGPGGGGNGVGPGVVPPPPPTPPPAPQNLRVTDRGANFVEWQWAAVSGAAGYQVQLSIGDDNFSPPDEEANLAANQTAVRFEDEQLAPGTTVYLRVRAFAGTQAAPVYGQFSGAVSGMTAGAPPPMESDRERLVALYEATGGEDWRNDENWLSDRPVDEWYGVETDREGRVVSLDLGDNDLEGEIPAELGDLNRLRAVDLGGNRLRGTIPPELGRLTGVQTVDLSENSLTGDIPPDLAEWGQLGDLDLSDNRLTGEIPSRLGNGGTVRRLDLGNNRLTGEIPPDLAEWSHLRDLDLGDNELDGEIPQAFGRLSPIRSVDLSGNRLSGRIPELSGEWMDYLENLDLGHNEFSGSIPATIGDARRLRGVDLGSNRLTGRIPPELGNLRDLVELDLGNEDELIPAGFGGRAAQTTGPRGGNALTGPIPPELGNLTRLEVLDLAGNELTGTIPPELGRLVELTTLNLASNPGLTGNLPEELTALANLEVLALQGTSVVIPNTPEFQIWLVRIPTVDVPEPPPVESPIEPSIDRMALEAFYRATDGPNWKDNTAWLTDAPLGDWHGVTTTADGKVRGIVLGENDLAGPVPPELGQLANLEILSLGRNRLSGAIPPELGQLANLTRLLLFENQLSGTIPPELGQLTNLETLTLPDNELSGTIPAALGRLAKLETLSLRGNQLEGELPPELGQLSNLGYLFLYDNKLRGRIPAELGRLSKLEQLRLDRNQLEGGLPSELGSLVNLKSLILSQNPALSGPVPDTFVALTALEQLRLQDTGVCVPTGSAFSSWLDAIARKSVRRCEATGDRAVLEALYNATDGPNWTNNSGWLSALPLGAWHGVTTDTDGRVTGLSLRENQLSGALPMELGNLTRVTWLLLSRNQLSGAIPPELGQLTELAYLELGSNRLNGTIPRTLGQLVNLEQLGLGGNLLEGAVPPELGSLTKLRILGLSGNTGLSGPLPDALTGLSAVETLLLTNTGLCAPTTTAFQNWLAAIADKSGVVNCAPDQVATPTGLHVSATTTGSVTWSWDPVGGADGYQVQYSRNDAFTATDPITDLAAAVLSFRIEELQPGTSHYLRVRAFVEAGGTQRGSPWSEHVTGMTDGPPPAPTGLRVAATTADSITWTWNAVEGAFGYAVQVSADEVFDNSDEVHGIVETSLTVTSLPPGTTVHVRVAAAAGAPAAPILGAWTAPVTGTSALPQPSTGDRAVLEALYNATDGPNWRNNTGWLRDGVPLGDWYGVTTDSDGNVTELSFRDNRLQGSIPPQLGSLTSLEVLDFYRNELRGSIPTGTWQPRSSPSS